MLVYVPGGDVGMAGIAWVNRQGQADFLPIEPRVYGMFDLSSDGRRLAIHVSDNKDYILIYDIEHDTSRRLPSTDSAGWPKWSPSGDALAYTSFSEDKPYRILVQRMDSDRPPLAAAEIAIAVDAEHVESGWTADLVLRVSGESPWRSPGSTRRRDGPASAGSMTFDAGTHDISADGRWLVYADAGINVRAAGR